MNSTGLKWTKLDLHVHTPGSGADFRGLDTTPEAIVRKAQEAGLDGLAVTDHNTGVWVDKLKEAAAGTGIVLFPGVEVTTAGGERNVHLLAIFDPSKGTAHVHDFLAQIGITEEKRGHRDALAEGDVIRVIERIAGNDGVALLAHCDSTSGVLKEIRGQARIKIVQNVNLLGAHITKVETLAFLAGSDPEYKRKLACFRSSDSHSLDEIGRDCSYFKLGTMSVAALRQCLYDPDTRIRSFDRPTDKYPAILEIRIRGGFLDGVSASFHAGLNSVLGGKGVGKSLIVEFLRFALGQPSHVAHIRSDMDGKLKKQLGLGGTITVVCQLASGTRYEIVRRYDEVDNPSTVSNLSDSTEYAGDVSRLFPILAYSQNEVIDISRDANAQLRLIDRLIDTDSYYEKINKVRAHLEKNVAGYMQSMLANEKVRELGVRIATAESQIGELDKILMDPMFTQKKAWDQRTQEMVAIDTAARSLSEEASRLLAAITDKGIPELSAEGNGDVDVSEYHAAIVTAAKKLVSDISDAIDRHGAALKTASVVHSRWEERKASWEVDFREFLSKSGGEQEALSKRRTQLEGELGRLKQERSSLVKEAELFKNLVDERERLLDQLDKAREEFSNARIAIYHGLTEGSEGQLMLSLKAGDDRSAFLRGLTELCHGQRIQKTNLGNVSRGLMPREFVSAVIAKNQKLLEQVGSLTPEASTRIVESIHANEDAFRRLLALPYECMPEDVPEIVYRKEDGSYYPLSELSVGQKCTALLLIALSESMMPVLIDQPEDALDVATVYLDIVKRLRLGKDQRQFIVTTHNANVAVSSDSDKFHVLRSNATAGQIACAGAIDLDQVAKEVIDHLEGGVEPYKLRGKKYNVSLN